MVTPFPYKPYYRKLVELERELRGKIGERSASSHSQAQSFSMHMADSGTDSIDRDDTLSLLESEKDALYEIDQAIERVHAGTYGICEITGEPISEARLWAVPWARYSLKAQQELERPASLPRPSGSSSRDPGSTGWRRSGSTSRSRGRGLRLARRRENPSPSEL